MIGHPLFGRKVQVIQCGETDTTQWALITHPDSPDLHYRIAQKWLQEDAPVAPDVHGRKSLEIVLEPGQLAALANFIAEKLKTINSLHSAESATTLVRIKKSTGRLNGDESSSTNLGKNSSKTDRLAELEVAGTHPIENQGEG